MDRLAPTSEIIDYLTGKSIAVVGNARAIRRRGIEIDSHDVVIRFNNFKVAGYEHLVGSKTNIWAHAYVDNLRSRIDEQYDYQWYPHEAIAEQQEIRLIEHPLRFGKDGEVTHCGLPIFNAAPLFVDPDPPPPTKIKSFNPTSGVKVLLWLYYRGFQFDHYGFDGLRSMNYFYKSDDQRLKSQVLTDFPYHDQQSEARLLLKLNKNKLIEAVVSTDFVESWARAKFHKVHRNDQHVGRDNLVLYLNSALHNSLIRKLTARARTHYYAECKSAIMRANNV